MPVTAPVPMAGVNPVDFLSKQEYTIDTIKKDMFSDPKEDKMKVMVPNVVVPGVTVSRLWDAVFADGSTFLQLYHDKRNERDLKVGSWIMAPDKGSGYRCVSLTTVVDVPRSGTRTPLNEAHRFCYVRTGSGLKLVYHISSQTPDVPFGSSFRTEALCFITADSDTADCSVAFWGKCRGMSFGYRAIRYIAEPRAIREMTAAYALVVALMQQVDGGAAMTSAVTGEQPTKTKSSRRTDEKEGCETESGTASVSNGSTAELPKILVAGEEGSGGYLAECMSTSSASSSRSAAPRQDPGLQAVLRGDLITKERAPTPEPKALPERGELCQSHLPFPNIDKVIYYIYIY
eukprot:gene1533-918_t